MTRDVVSAQARYIHCSRHAPELYIRTISARKSCRRKSLWGASALAIYVEKVNRDISVFTHIYTT